MTPERWHRVKDLFEAAVSLSPPARSEFLMRACLDDEEVKREVESLLRAHDLDSSFMNTPVATLLLDETTPLRVGQRFGNYERLAPIGSGGMSQVYSAIDTRLARKIALKFLASSLMHDTDRVRRFQQEARAASALNHPNIVTIHEIGQIDSLLFIATEFVDGQTLREELRRRRISYEEVLNIGIQIGSALQAAHEAGIIHRDIKPENIMIRRDGIVKVLDFGLAKLTPEKFEIHSQAPTKPMVYTKPGVVIGTAAYMSPEQARAADVDARTDIWSLGVVMYEMLSGRKAFLGETPTQVIAAITNHEPVPLSINSEIPDELQLIVNKCLIKNREQRYQTVSDVLADLKQLKQRLEVDAAIAGNAETRLLSTVTTSHRSTATDEAAIAQTRSRLGRSVSGLKSSRRRQWVIAGMLAFVALITPAAYWRYKLISAENAAVTQTTTSSSVRSIAVMPFENQTQTPYSAYLSDAISETISYQLMRLPDVKVTTRGPSQYKSKAEVMEEATNTLGVDAILTGAIAERGDNVVISLELIDARDKSQIWSEQYTRKLTDVLAVQLEISDEIVQQLRRMAFGKFVIELRR